MNDRTEDHGSETGGSPPAVTTEPEDISEHPKPPTDTRMSVTKSDDQIRVLALLDDSTWAQRTQEERRDHLVELDERYYLIVDEFLRTANVAVKAFKVQSKSHSNWRWTLILGTGALAMTNLLAAYVRPDLAAIGFLAFLGRELSIIAAIVAALIATLLNLESYLNKGERAQLSRRTRELFLDAHREFDTLWRVHVVPFGDDPSACANAGILLQRIVERDREIREQTTELNETVTRTSK